MATDRVSDVITAYFKAVDDREFDVLPTLIADDALVATVTGEMGRPRHIRTGKQLRRELEGRDPVPWRHELLDIHVHGAGALVEGELVQAASGSDRFLVFFAIDGEGRVAGLFGFRPLDADAQLPAEARDEWPDLAQRALDDRPPPCPVSAADLVTSMGAGSSRASGLSVLWMTHGRTPVAMVGRFGSKAEFAAVIRSESPDASPHVAVSWCPGDLEEKGVADA